MKHFLIAVLLFATTTFSQTPAGNRILEMIDDNLVSRNRTAVSTMIVHGRRASRTIKARSWIQGTEKSFTEYLSPAREKGTKMLKLGDELWTYSPQTDRIIRIAGHMLRQSVMGSDLSYEDMMEDPKLSNLYTAEVEREEVLDDRPCWVLHLTARKQDVAYASRKIWVDKERKLILREERYAKSGRLLKTAVVKGVRLIDGRWYPTHLIFKDELLGGKGTEFILEEVKFNVKIPLEIFSKAALKK